MLYAKAAQSGTMQHMNEISVVTLAVLAVLLEIIGTFPYVRDIIRHKTKPERATWWVWLALLVVALVAQIQAGATWSLALTLMAIITVGLIAVLSLWYGYGSFHRRDTLALVIAAAGLAVAQLVHSPLVALLVVIVVDLVGVWLTAVKTWVAPHTETLISWQLAVAAAICSTLAVGKWDGLQLLYPAYNVLADGAIVVIMMYRRPLVKHDPEDIPPDSLLA